MNVKYNSESFKEKILKCIAKNEVNNLEKFIYSFTDPDGSGRSGYSFGRSQFDVNHFGKARIWQMLTDLGLDHNQKRRVIENKKDIDDIQLLLKTSENKTIIDEFDREHIDESIQHVLNLKDMPNIHDDSAFAMLVDTHSQFRIDINGKTHQWLRWCNFEIGCVSAEDIMIFKTQNYDWGEKRPDDIERRYLNIRKIFKGM